MKRLLAVPAVLVFAALLGLTGCNQQQGTTVTVKLLNQWGTPATATVVYQVGNGEWKLATQKDYGVYTFVVPPGETRYGVSANCIPPIPILSTIGFFSTYQLTTNDATEVTFPCLNLSDQTFSSVSLSWDATNVGGDYFQAFSRLDSDDTGTSPLSIGTIVGPDEPFLFLAYATSASYANLKGVRFERFDTSPSMSHNVTFTAGDAVAFGTLSGPATPTGFSNCSFNAAFVTHDGLIADSLGEASGDPCSGNFLRIPGAASNDVLALMARYNDSANNRSLISLAYVDGNAASASLHALPSPWPTSYSVDAAALPTFTLDHPDGEPTAYVIFYNGTDGPFWQLYISPDWLAGASSYTLPDLSSAPDFGGIKLLSGEGVEWEVAAFFSDRPLGDWLAASSWLPAGGPVAMPVVPGAWMTAASIAGTYTVP